MERKNLSDVLRPGRTYPKHWEEVLQNHVIKEKKLSVLPMRPRAIDCGWYGTNKPTETLSGSLQDRIQAVRERAQIETPVWSSKLRITKDRRPLWSTAYEAQKKWGF
jgi:hypothetical protein